MKRKTLTAKQQKLIKGLTKGMSITDAALAAGYSDKCPGVVGSQALESIREHMPEVLERNGLTDDSVVKKYLKPLMNANETKFFAHEGVVKDEREVVAWGPRRDGLDMYFKLKGDYKQLDKAANVSASVTFVCHIEEPIREVKQA